MYSYKISRHKDHQVLPVVVVVVVVGGEVEVGFHRHLGEGQNLLVVVAGIHLLIA